MFSNLQSNGLPDEITIFAILSPRFPVHPDSSQAVKRERPTEVEDEREKGVTRACERERGSREKRRGAEMSLNQLRTGKVVRDAVHALASSYQGPIKVRVGRRDVRDLLRGSSLQRTSTARIVQQVDSRVLLRVGRRNGTWSSELAAPRNIPTSRKSKPRVRSLGWLAVDELDRVSALPLSECVPPREQPLPLCSVCGSRGYLLLQQQFSLLHRVLCAKTDQKSTWERNPC